jgi:hypothetical protein
VRLLTVFDVGNRASFEALDAWVEEAHKFGARDMHVVVCGNKADRCAPSPDKGREESCRKESDRQRGGREVEDTGEMRQAVGVH